MNAGKVFEADFKASIPKDTYYLRLHDSASGFQRENNGPVRFALRSPYDAVLCRGGKMYAIELKTHRGTSVSFSGGTPAIKDWQITELEKAEAAGAEAGIVINFREKGHTVYIRASVFRHYMETAGRKSINVTDALKIGTEIQGHLLRTHYRYDLGPILQTERTNTWKT